MNLIIFFDICMPLEKKDTEMNPFEAKLKNDVDRDFRENESLFDDVLNDWKTIVMIAEAELFTSLKPLLHYQDFYQKSFELYLKSMLVDVEHEERDPQEFAELEEYLPMKLDRIMELSDPKQIEHYNMLVDEFNADLKRIKAEKDVKTVRDFHERAKIIVHEKRPEQVNINIIFLQKVLHDKFVNNSILKEVHPALVGLKIVKVTLPHQPRLSQKA